MWPIGNVIIIVLGHLRLDSPRKLLFLLIILPFISHILLSLVAWSVITCRVIVVLLITMIPLNLNVFIMIVSKRDGLLF